MLVAFYTLRLTQRLLDARIHLYVIYIVSIAGDARQLDDTDVSISNCKKGRCRLRKRTKVSIEMKLSPDHDVKKLTTNVAAIILGVPLPFIGVDGTSACNNVYTEDGKEKTKCPLKAGQKYVYKNSFDVLPVYPSIPDLTVHWSLTEGNSRDLVCFELPAKITN